MSSKQAKLQERIEALESKSTQSALVFLKPAVASNPKVKALVHRKLAEAGAVVTGSRTLHGTEIDEEGLIDAHYGAIASTWVYIGCLNPHAKSKKKKDNKED